MSLSFKSIFRRRFVCHHSSHRASIDVCVVALGRKRILNSWVYLGLAIISGTDPNDIAFPGFIMCSGLSELDEVLNKLTQGLSVQPLENTDTSGEDIDADQPWGRVLPRRTFKVKKKDAVDKLARFFVTGPSNAVKRTSKKYCCICREGVLVLTHGLFENLWHLEGHSRSFSFW